MQNTNNNQIASFDGKFAHPSLDYHDGILLIGFRYRTQKDGDKEFFIASDGGNFETASDDTITMNQTTYSLDKRGRRLARVEEKWNAKELMAFLENYQTLKASAPSSKATFDGILAVIKKYIDLHDDIDYALLAAWIVGTYFHPIFSAYPFLHVKAPKRSGKSQCLNVLSQLSFNAIKARPSLAALSDTVDALRGTYLIDQADSLGRKGTEELLDVLADSYKKSGGKRRIVNFDKKRGREVLEFETYGPKAFASIRDLPEDLRDRCIVIPLIRSKKNFADPDDGNENWNALRGNLYKILLTSFPDIDSSYQTKKILYRRNQEILGRSLELWLPFEVVLENFGAGNLIEIAKHRFLSQYGFTEYEPSELEEAVVLALHSALQAEPEIVFTPKEIADLLDPDIFPPNDTPKQRASKVGWAIKKFNLSSEKRSRTKEGYKYLFQAQKVAAIADSYLKTAENHTPHTPALDSPVIAEQK